MSPLPHSDIWHLSTLPHSDTWHNYVTSIALWYFTYVNSTTLLKHFPSLYSCIHTWLCHVQTITRNTASKFKLNGQWNYQKPSLVSDNGIPGLYRQFIYWFVKTLHETAMIYHANIVILWNHVNSGNILISIQNLQHTADRTATGLPVNTGKHYLYLETGWIRWVVGEIDDVGVKYSY